MHLLANSVRELFYCIYVYICARECIRASISTHPNIQCELRRGIFMKKFWRVVHTHVYMCMYACAHTCRKRHGHEV